MLSLFLHLLRQRPKNLGGRVALPSGKFLRVTLEIALGSFRMVWKVSGESGKCPDGLESFRMVWKLSGWSGKFLDCLETFRMVWKISGWSGKFPDGLESFRMV